MVVNRKDIKEKSYRLVLDTETHHDHVIETDVNGVYRWKADERVRELTMNSQKINFNELIYLFHSLGYDKNSEPYRQLYRDMGYSLYGYWEIFYWEVNNPDAKKYKPNKSALGKK